VEGSGMGGVVLKVIAGVSQRLTDLDSRAQRNEKYAGKNNQ